MRLFIAVEISEEIKTELTKIIDKLKEADADVKWVGPEGMHITLKFLGEVDEKRKDKIIERMEKIFTPTPKILVWGFTVTFKGLGAFPDFKRPRVVWLGIEKGKEELTEVAKELDACLSELGFPAEKREFSPHLTLGRVKSSRGREKLMDALSSYNNFVLPKLTVNEIILMQSILKREGAEYKRVKEFCLRKG
jgi:2'-5' RNA ligase